MALGRWMAGGLAVAVVSGCVQKGEVSVVNRLAQSPSPYLRSAAHQPIGWYEWGEEAFAAAKTLDRPILLDVGAVWCHWCHVIDRESYENPDVAKIINERFIPIKVDVDARPDIDRRYQEIVSALTGQGGWPLTVFLTPAGEVIYGGTYFPPEDRWGMPGMKGVLTKIADLYQSNKPQVLAQARQLQEEFGKHRAQAAKPGEMSSAILDRLAAALKNHHDEEYGGFGDAPKFPNGSALELAMQLSRRGDAALLKVAAVTLDRMAAGGIHDQLTGAFHRYSVDRFWRVPHLEIMLTVNAELLAAYVHAYQLTQEPRYRAAAEGILRYVTTTLSDQARGGFYGSQDADYSPDDDGDYYTWTTDEAKAALSSEEFEVLSRYYDIAPQGEMRENPAKNVLFIAETLEAIAAELKRPVAEVEAVITRGREKLLAARRRRKTPFVDPTLYVHWNALMLSPYLEAAAVFGLDEVRAFALKTLDRLLEAAQWPEGGLSHLVADGQPRVPGLLEDYVQLALACADAYQVTQEPRYLATAARLADEAIQRFWDEAGGGFFDTQVRSGPVALLQERRKPIQDAPTPSGNGVAVLLLQRLAVMTGRPRYQELAARTLQAFAGTIPESGLFAATLGQGADLHLHPPAHVVITGDPAAAATRALIRAAWTAYAPGKVIEVKSGAAARPTATVCVGTSCRPPVTDPTALIAALTGFAA